MPNRGDPITLEKPPQEDEAQPRRRQPLRLARRDDFSLVRSDASTLTIDGSLVSRIEVLRDRVVIQMREE